MPRRPRYPSERIVVALDLHHEAKLRGLVRALRGRVGMFKVGKELFTSLGPRAVQLVRDEGGEVFLDLKYHDIPNTVAAAVRAAAGLGVAMLTVHAAGGRTMLSQAVTAAREHQPRPAIIAITLLTSLQTQDLQELGMSGDFPEGVERLGRLALEAGVDGLVASPQEVGRLRAAFGARVLLVTPGVRPLGTPSHDQARVATPTQAVADGADFLVIGRPITYSADPAAAVDDIVREIEEGA